VLILNEFTERLDYNTLTFGLTTGWWLFEDDAFRIEGAPLLDRDSWRHVLTGNGIAGFRFLDLSDITDAGVGQCLIVGESDGRALLQRPVAPEETLAVPPVAVSRGRNPTSQPPQPVVPSPRHRPQPRASRRQHRTNTCTLRSCGYAHWLTLRRYFAKPSE
jgi:hypothetical protein